MGAWGLESCSNDTCWDWLEAENIHEMTQQECDKAVLKIFSLTSKSKDFNSFDSNTELKQTQLGITIWVLNHARTVAKKYLMKARANAKSLLKNSKYLETWVPSERRKRCLEQEIKDITTALKCDGKGKEKHVDGLFAKIDKVITSEKSSTNSKKAKVLVVCSTDEEGVLLPITVFDTKNLPKAEECFKDCVRKLDDVFGDDMESCVVEGYFNSSKGTVVLIETTIQ